MFMGKEGRVRAQCIKILEGSTANFLQTALWISTRRSVSRTVSEWPMTITALHSENINFSEGMSEGERERKREKRRAIST
jgi:hypothetical protein